LNANSKKFSLDKSEPDKKGLPRLLVRSYLYEITFQDVVYCARSYTDSRQELFFLSCQVDGQKDVFPKILYEDKFLGMHFGNA